ncbi:hypothetical protein OS175_07570 [Marinicella sp. S1101]|uniref:hypothetical protein n=1 Tax=Marinicella marina TaxID=2996016 RepID=UPI002260B8A4|nr:hypothetical protein [Marinicella marina]MCX7553733.1 hypothetical protein [Marinicella marina]MDJ1140808.1 hypothetical protein [Marinicella marina]
MTTLTDSNRKQNGSNGSVKNAAGQLGTMVYFRGVNRVQINRFKAYLLIFSSRLQNHWQVTDDIKSAQILIEWKQQKSSQEKHLSMAVLSGTVNQRPQVIKRFPLDFDEARMVNQLNQAYKLLRRSNNTIEEVSDDYQDIMVSGLLNLPLSQVCEQFNNLSQKTEFSPCVDLFSGKNDVFREKLLLLVDPTSADSIQAYKTLIKKKRQGDLIISELIIGVIQSANQHRNEAFFDQVYNHSDANTQVTMVDLNDESSLVSVVTYL